MRSVGSAAAIVAMLLGNSASGQDTEAGRKKAEGCLVCHGPVGIAEKEAMPSLHGQTARYIYLQLKDFKEGRRSDPQMDPWMAEMTREDMYDLAAFFSAERPLAPRFKPDSARVEKGKAKAAETLCTMCHQGGFMGQNEIPRVAGQTYEYIVKQLRDFRSGKRTNDAATMKSVSKTLSDEDIENLAHFLVDLQ